MDDDAKFQKRTRGYVIHTQDLRNKHFLFYISHEGFTPRLLSTRIDSTLQHLVCIDDELFIPLPSKKIVLVIDLVKGEVKENLFFGEDFYPVDIVQYPDKKDWYFIASTNSKIAFFNRKKNKAEVQTYSNFINRIDHIVYANNKIYAASRHRPYSIMLIVDVPTRALIKEEYLEGGVKELHSGILWVKSISMDSLPISYTCNVNDDILQKNVYSYPLRQFAHSPYTQRFYGREFIGFIELYNNKIYVNQIALPSNTLVKGFIPDFDESRLVAYSGNRLYYYRDLSSREVQDSLFLDPDLKVLHGVVHRR
ncbi:MAG: hypothetical protein NZ455_08755 [Bacteroidia bacterium]|nr:hypothetical protein [Bacteroidia bacterium]MDW8346456.1 hypothetical protein [Bacteroidia bacterium]